MEFIESPLFSKLISSYLDNDEYAAFQWDLALHPEKGDIIPSSGGLRKIRWSAKGKGKRGGVRVIYFYQNKQGQIWLLTIYAKNEDENIPLSVLKKVKKELEI
ncbi:type II toxin-antitoxin system RelE/ParE family toxin [Candidatus Odyssella acanthamoebae]|uniref:Transcriptional regulator n=1 Tax=Candidatus Odyssella acanthamoebae TaxID=91604 RepID=A0A077ATD2_9PROT|nr:type II toxin-antitoxin system RelE/ParE family toxin [Candidatus Paracaedibacter acanthamoebae]AIK95656.1 transcriptional regulator [Candidatus Paracaedibacter acanthamoebae]